MAVGLPREPSQETTAGALASPSLGGRGGARSAKQRAKKRKGDRGPFLRSLLPAFARGHAVDQAILSLPGRVRAPSIGQEQASRSDAQTGPTAIPEWLLTASYSHPTRILLASYSHPTRILLASYSHPGPVLGRGWAGSAAENGQKQPDSSIGQSTKKKAGRDPHQYPAPAGVQALAGLVTEKRQNCRLKTELQRRLKPELQRLHLRQSRTGPARLLPYFMLNTLAALLSRCTGVSL